jgi:glycosyltransferase involved in cell wall biosynthesis
MNDLTLLTCNFNTPYLIDGLLKSLIKTSSSLPKILVMDTSTEQSCIVPDHIPSFRFTGGTHGEAVNLAFKKIKTRYVLLVDSDILFLQDFKKPFEVFKQEGAAAMGKIVGDVAGKSLYPRIEPWYCFLDLSVLNQFKIPFFDAVRTSNSKNSNRIYDIGSTMFEDLNKRSLKIIDVDLEGKYFKHYGGMSWHIFKFDPTQKDTDVDFGGTHPNQALYTHGRRVLDAYNNDSLQYFDIDIRQSLHA